MRAFNIKSRTGEIAVCAAMTALAMILSYVERLIPLPVPVPGIKPGLANTVTIVCFYLIGKKQAWIVALLRIALLGILFGNLYSFVFSAAGGVLSLLAMTAAAKVKAFSPTGVSIIGGIAHNAGQLAAAIVMLKNVQIIAYLPALIIGGAVCGIIIGLLASLIIHKISKVGKMHE